MSFEEQALELINRYTEDIRKIVLKWHDEAGENESPTGSYRDVGRRF
jgi:hypothetical protein